MGLARLNRIVMEVLPFTFGMTYEDVLRDYDEHHAALPTLFPSDPRTWDEATRAECDRRAAWESAVADELMAIEEHDAFLARLDYYRAHPYTPAHDSDPR